MIAFDWTEVADTLRLWSTVVDQPGHDALVAALPDRWSLAADGWYCGNSWCRRVEFHRDHGEGPHVGCYVTKYGTYGALMNDAKALEP